MASGAVTTSVQQGIVATYTYDILGNNTAINDGGIRTTMTYDKENRQRELFIQSSNSLAATYRYDGDGLKRYSEEASSGVSTLVWDGTDYMQSVLATRANAASYDSHTFPTQVTAGSVTSVTVKMRNTGTNTWDPVTLYSLGSQAPQDTGTWNAGRVNVTERTVRPGALATFTFNITAPSVAGVYAIQFRMVQDAVEWFGNQTPMIWIKVI